ncbi:hypothetical protein CEXT_725901 [Caerostris extrusa]|uniref:Uncharacterized protein n=1 Tax=Caerostris extrusa TaxID=172846 RepID=A0AAV4XR51_CAEEX|nr:hypothetical protein CEXT_725901 [Caerostris extrusa]
MQFQLDVDKSRLAFNGTLFIGRGYGSLDVQTRLILLLLSSDYRSVNLLTTSTLACCENLKTGFSSMATDADLLSPGNPPTSERGWSRR